jgi:23S rRNA (adenine2503-C2)-methyltransferase
MPEPVARPPLIYDYTHEALGERLESLGAEAYRISQVWDDLYRHGIDDPAKMRTLPAALRSTLQEHFRFRSLTEDRVFRSTDGGTEKFVFSLPDQHAIETVLMRYDRRRTACISTQAGCGMGCVFCATGQMGFLRNLSAGEIIEQVLILNRRLRQEGSHLTNVVVMGMGEPFHNYDATLQAIDILGDERGMNMGARRFTISTVGLVPMIERFTQERRQINLAISLHAATDELRESLLPVNRRYPLADLMRACRDYVDRTHRRITFEWALIEGVNDTPEQAEALAGWLRGLNCHTNLIPLNPTDGYRGQATRHDRVDAFLAMLHEKGLSATIRVRRGIDIQAGCGQLATQQQS